MASNVYKSAAQVTVFSTIEKTLSFAYRIILSRLIGAEGIGIYQICLSVFSVFLTAASSGIPVTVSRMIAKQSATGSAAGKHAVVTAGVVSTLMFTVPAAIIIFFGRNLLAFLFPDKESLNIFILLLPGLILTSVYAVMRGTFWGNKQFMPYSLIELAEDSVMVILGTVLVFSATSPTDGAYRATAAALISYIFSFLVSVGWYLMHGGKFVNPKSQLRPLLASAMPITAMRTSTSLLNSVVATFLPALLIGACGYDSSEALALYGAVTGMSLPVLMIPNSLIGSIAVVVAPEMSEHYYAGRGDRLKRDIEKTIKAAVFIAALLIPALFTLGGDIGIMLFGNAFSGEVITKFAFMLLPLCISMITTTALNSMNCEVKTLIYFFIGALFMLVCIFALTPIAGIYSYMIGLAGSYVITAALNLHLLRKKCPDAAYFKHLAASAAICVFGSLFGLLLRRLTAELTPVLKVIICGGAVTAFTLTAFWGLGMVSIEPVKKLFRRR
ncbi:MAG TPA: oligosaccharide flippase family protein [Candidatus Coproplasma excrementipullorum]|nr:oligosaccharide flippase family protein [Candidatus Coproplasma excrementipullorum]